MHMAENTTRWAHEFDLEVLYMFSHKSETGRKSVILDRLE